jgi:hypothetical protein
MSVTIEVTETASTMHVGDLDGSSTNLGASWTATVTITIHDGSHNPVANATVSSTWSGPISATDTCTTDSNGQCSRTSPSIHKRWSTVTFTVDGVAHATLTYDATANHDPDGDSNGTSITVAKP